MSDRDKLPGDSSLPPGVSQDMIDAAAEGRASRYCLCCGDLLLAGEKVVCDSCNRAEEEGD